MTLQTEPVVVNVGPQHPSTDGVFRMRVAFDGEIIVDMEPIFGYLHRGSEKLAEERLYTQVITLTDRMDYVSSMTNNQAYVLAVEKLAGIEPMPRGVWLRMISAELQRIANHVARMGFLLQGLGAFATPLMYAFREREDVLDLFELLCGARITNNYHRASGVYQDAPAEFWPALQQFLEEMPHRIDEYEELITGNEIFLARTRGMAAVPREQLINSSVSGPMLRAAGIDWDVRDKDPYEYYDRVNFSRPIMQEGDNFARYLVRIYEMRESIKIIRQSVEQIEPGPVRDKDVPYVLRPPKGDAYAHIEAPKGDLGFYLVSDGGVSPYRCKVRPPSLVNLTLLRDMVVGHTMADLISTFVSIDVVMGEVDR